MGAVDEQVTFAQHAGACEREARLRVDAIMHDRRHARLACRPHHVCVKACAKRQCQKLIPGAEIGALQAAKVGTLTPGKEADILMLRADRFDVWPLNNAPSVVANLMNPSHVEAVFIAGKVKKWRGSLVGVDAARVLRLAQEARAAVMRRGNFALDVVG